MYDTNLSDMLSQCSQTKTIEKDGKRRENGDEGEIRGHSTLCFVKSVKSQTDRVV